MGPGQPQNLQLLTTSLNATWVFLGRIVTAGTAVNNATTAAPFKHEPRGGNPAPGDPINYENTLAGKVLIVQAVTDAVLILPGTSLAAMVAAPVTVAAGVNPGLRFGVGERPNFVMGQQEGWLQIISEGGGAATLLVWEQRP